MRGRDGGGAPLILLTLVIVQADKSMHADPLTKVLLNILGDTPPKKGGCKPEMVINPMCLHVFLIESQVFLPQNKLKTQPRVIV